MWMVTKNIVATTMEYVPLAKNVELLIGEQPSNKGKMFKIQIVGHVQTKKDMDAVVADLAEAFELIEGGM